MASAVIVETQYGQLIDNEIFAISDGSLWRKHGATAIPLLSGAPQSFSNDVVVRRFASVVITATAF